MRILLIFLLLNLSQNLKPILIVNEKVEMLLPSGFKIMSEEMLMTKYPSGNRPTLVYTNDEGTVNLAVNHTKNHIALDQLEEAKGIFVGQFEQIYPEAQWYRQEMIQINGRDFVVLELV